jgi:hypothetical protein
MIDLHKEMVSALNTVLPTYYELTLTANTKTPCISYQERNNYIDASGDTIGYSKIIYTVKVWSNNIVDLQRYSIEVDNALRAIGFKRTSTNELHDINSTMIQKIFTYECLALENY